MPKKKEQSYQLSYESDGEMGKPQKHNAKNSSNKEREDLFSNINQYSE